MGFKRHSRRQVWNRVDYEPEAVARCRQSWLSINCDLKLSTCLLSFRGHFFRSYSRKKHSIVTQDCHISIAVGRKHHKGRTLWIESWKFSWCVFYSSYRSAIHLHRCKRPGTVAFLSGQHLKGQGFGYSTSNLNSIKVFCLNPDRIESRCRPMDMRREIYG